MTFNPTPGRANEGILRLQAVSKAAAGIGSFKIGTYLPQECGSSVTHYYKGTFQRDTDSGPIIGCFTRGSGSFVSVFKSTQYNVEGVLRGSLPGPMVAGLWPSQPRDPVTVSFRRHFTGDGAGAEQKPQFGVGFVPFPGDDEGRAMTNVIAAYPTVDRLFHPRTPTDIFGTLLKLRRTGKQVTHLVIGGHGSKDDPAIQLPGGDLDPRDVDLPALRADLASAQQVKDPRPSDRRRVSELKSRIAYLESIAHAMAKDAEVLLINCSAAATVRGRQFVKNLGEIFLSKRGGVIIASKNDVEFGQVRSIANKIRAALTGGGNVEVGEFYAAGKWVRFPIAPKR